ncbi:ATP-binding protein, partial [Chryseobacterium sp. EO14]|uniref:ATP-binding protein n=1 Tax=Chryseobacterium sp. EO14 TaxID=2950551 RepID=UPI00210ABC61
TKAESFYYKCYENFSEAYVGLNNKSQAEYYLAKAAQYSPGEAYMTHINYIYARLYYQFRDYSKAKHYLQQSIATDEKLNASNLGEDYILMAEILNASGSYTDADAYLHRAISIFKKNNEEENLKISYDLILKNYFQKENIKEYLQYYQDHIQLATKIDNRANILALHDLDKRYKTLEKESKIKTQQLEIQKAQTNKNYALGGIAFLAMLLGGSFWFFKNRQKTTKLATQNTLFSLQQNMRVMELQNLNQQLDSHDVKNLLGDMSSEIQEKAPDSYKKMIKFLNITKASLYRDSFTDPIEKQLQQAEDFLSLQQSSLAEPLHYHIENTLKDNQIEIPRLMLKNLVENAVKHGIKGKEGGGNITVSLTEDGHFLTIIVDDTGKGRTLKTLSNKGIGISTYQNLFATLNQKNKENAVFEMTDKKQGVKV